MAHRNDPTGRALELARSATPARARHRTTLATVARPAAEVAGLLLVEVLGNPRARAAALDVARSLARWLADRRRSSFQRHAVAPPTSVTPPSPVMAGAYSTSRQLTWHKAIRDGTADRCTS
jgi:hypothetical protein